MALTKRIKRLKQGVTMHLVHAFPDKKEGWIDTYLILGRVIPKSPSGFTVEFVPYAHIGTFPEPTIFLYQPERKIRFTSVQQLMSESHKRLNEFSLTDSHFRNQSYNCHRAFFSLRKAKRYLKMVQEGCDVSTMFPGYGSFDDDCLSWYGEEGAGFDSLEDEYLQRMSPEARELVEVVGL